MTSRRAGLILALGALGLAGAAVLAAGPAGALDEAEPNNDAPNATLLGLGEVGVGAAASWDRDYWALNSTTAGFALVTFRFGAQPYGNASFGFSAGQACTSVVYSVANTLVLNLSAGAPCAFEVDATGDESSYAINSTFAEALSALAPAGGEIEPDEAAPNTRGNGEIGRWEGVVTPELDPADLWAFTAPEGAYLVNFSVMSRGGDGTDFTVEVRSGGIVIVLTPKPLGGTYWTANYLSTPGNRTIAVAILANGKQAFYQFDRHLTNLAIIDPLTPDTSEIDGHVYFDWVYAPRQSARVQPLDDRALTDGELTIWGKALCIVSTLANDNITVRVDLGRTFGPNARVGGGFVSARNQTVTAQRGVPACFDVLSTTRDWRHDGPPGSYFHSGLLYTIAESRVREIHDFFSYIEAHAQVDAVSQIALWALYRNLDADNASAMGASPSAVSDAISILQQINTTTALNPPPPGPVDRSSVPPSNGGTALIVIVAIVALLAVAAGIWVWEPKFLPPWNKRR